MVEIAIAGILAPGSKALALSPATEIAIPVSFQDACLLMVMGKMIKRMLADQ